MLLLLEERRRVGGRFALSIAAAGGNARAICMILLLLLLPALIQNCTYSAHNMVLLYNGVCYDTVLAMLAILYRTCLQRLSMEINTML